MSLPQDMNPLAIFVLQFAWFVVVWTTIAVVFVAPKLRAKDPDDALAVWIAPQMFRVLGLGLLVPQLAPEMPRSFAVSTATGDAITAVLALAAVVALSRRWAWAWALAWACTVVGSVDLTVALVQAARVEAARYLAAQWFVPAVLVPLMAVSHAMAFRALVATRRGGVRLSVAPPR